MDETIEQKSSDERRAQVEEAAAQVAELEREQQEATARLANPATVFDPALAVELRKRLGELPLYLNAARLKHASLRVEMFDAEAAEHKARLPELHEAMLEEQTRYDAARAVYQTAVAGWQGAHADSKVSSIDANEARALVRRLQSEAQAMQGVAHAA
jgi:chromosome segregation ATPase